MVLEDVVEVEISADGQKTFNKLDQILLNGNNIALMIPGGPDQEKYPEYFR